MIVECIFVLAMALYIYNYWATNYWKRRNVFTVPGEFLGNTKKLLSFKLTTQDFFKDLYEKYKDKKLIGFYNLYEPMLIVTDPDLVRQILTTDFNSFGEQSFHVDEKKDPVVAINPFFVKGHQEWKNTRALHTPMQTQLRLKDLTPNITKVGNTMIKYVAENKSRPIKVRELTKWYTTGVICATAYGLEPNAFTDPNNPFIKSASPTVFDNSVDKAFVIGQFIPFLNRITPYRIISTSGTDFFKQMARTMVNHRKETALSRNDYIDHLLRLDKRRKEEGQKGFTDDELAGHLMTAYTDAVESSSIIMSFLLLELANHPEIQEKIRRDIFEVGKEPEDFTYEKAHAVPYLSMTLNEILRLHPLTAFLSRQCTKNTVLGGVEIEKGIKLFIPYQGIVMDPEYFPNPNVFDPERFSEENKSSIVKGTFLPFGDGPRQCLGSWIIVPDSARGAKQYIGRCTGMKYALLQIYLGIIYLLLKYRLLPANKDSIGENVKNSIEFSFVLAPVREETIIFEPL